MLENMLPLRSPPRTQVDYNLKYAHKMGLKPAVCHHIHKKNCPSNIRLATSDYRQHGNLLAVTCARSASLSQTIAKLSVLTMNVQFIIVINHFTPRKKTTLKRYHFTSKQMLTMDLDQSGEEAAEVASSPRLP